MRRRFFLAAASLAMVAAGNAAAASLILAPPKPLSADIAAFPRIIAPRDEASSRINAALAGLDRAALRAAAECLAQAKHAGAPSGDWERKIAVTMREPRLLSFLVTDSYFCGGAHPDAETWPLVFDLASGRPVDWTRLMPPALLGKPTLDTDPQTAGRLSFASPGLHALYMAGYGGQKSTRDLDPDCRDAMADLPDPPTALIWPDPARGGLMINFEVANAMAVCAAPVVVTVARLKALGASPTLSAALLAARAAP